jgi:hypothetical protein
MANVLVSACVCRSQHAIAIINMFGDIAILSAIVILEVVAAIRLRQFKVDLAGYEAISY